MANTPPPEPLPMIPVMALTPVFVPLRVRVVVFPVVADPVTAPMPSRLLAEVALAVKAAVAALVPEMVIGELMVSVWSPLPARVWITPPLFRISEPPLSV